MQAKKSVGGWVLLVVGALLLGLILFYLWNPRFFGERFIHFDGSVKTLEPVGDGQLLVIEHVQTGGGEDGPITVGDRWRIVEAATGKPVAGPHYVDPIYWAAMSGGDRFVTTVRNNLEVRGLDNKLLATLETFPNGERLRRASNELTMGPDGRVTALSDDGRFYVLDPHTLQSTLVDGRARGPSANAARLSSASVKGLNFDGSPRARINKQGPDFLEPSWVEDAATDSAIPAAGGYVMLHYQRMGDSKEGRGPMLSAVNASGVEAWKYLVPFEHLRSVAVVGNLLVISLDEREDLGPAWLRALDLADGHEVWKTKL